MPDLVTTISTEWQVISSAPWSFGISAIAVAVAVWGVLKWTYAERIETLNTRLQARSDEIDALKAKLAEELARPKREPPTDPDEIEQLDRIVGKLNAPDIRRGDGVVLATSLMANGDYNEERPFMFRGMRLMLVRWKTAVKTRNAGEIRNAFQSVVCEILD